MSFVYKEIYKPQGEISIGREIISKDQYRVEEGEEEKVKVA